MGRTREEALHPRKTIKLTAKGNLLTERDPDRIAEALGKHLVTIAIQHGDGPVPFKL